MRQGIETMASKLTDKQSECLWSRHLLQCVMISNGGTFHFLRCLFQLRYNVLNKDCLNYQYIHSPDNLCLWRVALKNKTKKS